MPLVRVGGYFLAMKAESAAEELQEARPAIERLGGEVVALRRFSLPEGDERGIIIVKKISQTPTVYPRNGGKIAKSPLKGRRGVEACKWKYMEITILLCYPVTVPGKRELRGGYRIFLTWAGRRFQEAGGRGKGRDKPCFYPGCR